MHHDVDAVVVGVGSGGTLTGLSRFFARVQPDCEIVLADPEGSLLTDYIRDKHIGTAGSWLVEVIGEDFVPEIADLSRVKKAYSIPDKESFSAGRELLRSEGIFGGSSSGTLFATPALQIIAKDILDERKVMKVFEYVDGMVQHLFSMLSRNDKCFASCNRLSVRRLRSCRGASDSVSLLGSNYRPISTATINPHPLTGRNKNRTHNPMIKSHAAR
jgi:hypothetical protein